MAQIRKTRQQKIKRAQKQPAIDSNKNKSAGVESPTTESTAISKEAELASSGTYQIVATELRQILLISAICMVLLVVATFLLSDLLFVQWLRNSLGLGDQFQQWLYN